jgi:hypothetical protein
MEKERRLYKMRQTYQFKIKEQIREIDEKMRCLGQESHQTPKIRFCNICFIREFDNDGYSDYTKEIHPIDNSFHTEKKILRMKKDNLMVQLESLHHLDKEYYKIYGV